MKTLSKVFLLLLFLYPPISAQSQVQEVPSVNEWKYGIDLVNLPDFSKTKSFFFTDHNSQVFANYGNTRYPTFWNFQVTWYKDFSGLFTTPDTVYLDCKFLSGTNVEKIKTINVFIAIQNSNKYHFDGRITQYNNIPLNSVWKRLYWDMKHAKDFGLTSWYSFYIAFQIVTTDSCYVGAEIEVKDLRGYYSDTQKTIVYDSFSGLTKVSDLEIPTGFVLSQNYPNPFNPSTTIHYSIPNSQFITLKVYDILGKEIATLVNEYKIAGNYEAAFNASNLPSGMYIYRLQGQNVNLSNKMMLIK
jgi:hypothetical protein